MWYWYEIYGVGLATFFIVYGIKWFIFGEKKS